MNEPQLQIYEFDKFRVDAAKRLLTKADGEQIRLTPKVFDTLLYLVRNGGKVIEKDELMREIWTDSIVEENNLTQNVSILRRVFGEKPGEHRFIVTVAGHGYRFVPDVRAISDLGFGIADIKPKKTVFENESEKIENQIAKDKKRSIKHEKPNRSRLVAVFSGLISLSLLGFYAWRGNEKSVTAPIKTVAVLPFKTLAAQSRDEALELGMADTLISKLSGGEEVTVRPLSSVRRYVALEQNSVMAGRELGVESVLDGTIQTADNRIRISARLFRVSDGKQLWTGQFDEKFTDIFDLQDSISERVATALRIRLGGKEKKRQTENVEAYQLYMKGRFHVLKAIKSEIATGISYFGQAIEADPGYGFAHVGIADAYRAMTLAGEMPANEFLPKAKAAANKAIEIDETLAEAHSALGSILFWYDWDWNAPENQFKRALELDPNSSDTHLFYAHLLSNTGRHTEALAKIKRARELDPLNLRINALEGLFLLHAGQIDEAITIFQKTLELDPNFRLANMFVARAYIEKGMFAEAIAATRKARELSAVATEPIAYGSYAYAESGNLVEARAGLDELIKFSKARWVPPYNIALIYNALGESGKALDYLEKAYAEKDVRMVFLKVEPKWNNIRNEPRFIDLMRRMNFK